MAVRHLYSLPQLVVASLVRLLWSILSINRHNMGAQSEEESRDQREWKGEKLNCPFGVEENFHYVSVGSHIGPLKTEKILQKSPASREEREISIRLSLFFTIPMCPRRGVCISIFNVSLDQRHHAAARKLNLHDALSHVDRVKYSFIISLYFFFVSDKWPNNYEDACFTIKKKWFYLRSDQLSCSYCSPKSLNDMENIIFHFRLTLAGEWEEIRHFSHGLFSLTWLSEEFEHVLIHSVLCAAMLIDSFKTNGLKWEAYCLLAGSLCCFSPSAFRRQLMWTETQIPQHNRRVRVWMK